MADGTKIEWTDATVNAVNGCSVVSPGCTNCYAMRLAGTRLKHHPSRAGLTIDTKAGPVWNGEIRVSEKAMLEPLRWRRPRMLFWNAHGDLFHPKVPDEVIDRCFAVMALTPQHIHQVLTKRSERMRAWSTSYIVADRVWDQVRRLCENWSKGSLRVMLRGVDGDPFLFALGAQGAAWGGERPWPLPNVWLGTSTEDQQRADERIPYLLATPAAVRFVSAEPLLGPIDLDCISTRCRDIYPLTGREIVDIGGGDSGLGLTGKLDWIIAGGESGPGARPMHPDWARSLRDQCAAAGVPFFFKQWGEWAPKMLGDGDRGLHQWVLPPSAARFGPPGPAESGGALMVRRGKKAAGHLLDGVEHRGIPHGQ